MVAGFLTRDGGRRQVKREVRINAVQEGVEPWKVKAAINVIQEERDPWSNEDGSWRFCFAHDLTPEQAARYRAEWEAESSPSPEKGSGRRNLAQEAPAREESTCSSDEEPGVSRRTRSRLRPAQTEQPTPITREVREPSPQGEEDPAPMLRADSRVCRTRVTQPPVRSVLEEDWDEQYTASEAWKYIWEVYKKDTNDWAAGVWVEDGKLIMRGLVCVPEPFHQRLLEELHHHLGRTGIAVMAREMSRRYNVEYGVKVEEMIKKLRQECLVFQAT